MVYALLGCRMFLCRTKKTMYLTSSTTKDRRDDSSVNDGVFPPLKTAEITRRDQREMRCYAMKNVLNNYSSIPVMLLYTNNMSRRTHIACTYMISLCVNAHRVRIISNCYSVIATYMSLSYTHNYEHI